MTTENTTEAPLDTTKDTTTDAPVDTDQTPTEPTQIATDDKTSSIPDKDITGTIGPDALTPAQFEELKTGHAGADAALGILLENTTLDFVKKNITEPLENGKTVDQLDTKLLEDKLGKDKAALVLAGIKDFHTEEIRQLQARESAIVETAGSKENLKTLITWAQNKCLSDPSFVVQANEINAMLSHSPVTARAGIALLRTLYEKSSDTSSLEKRVVSGDGTSGVSSAEYIDKYEAHKLITAARRAGDKETERQITARRSASARAERLRQV